MYVYICIGILTSDMENHPLYYLFIHGQDGPNSSNTNGKAATKY